MNSITLIPPGGEIFVRPNGEGNGISIGLPFPTTIVPHEDIVVTGTTHVANLDRILEPVSFPADISLVKDPGSLHDSWTIKVMMDPGRIGFAPVGAGVLPFLGERAVHALDLAVLPGAVGPRVDMACAFGLEQRVELVAAVARAIIGHHALDPHAHSREKPQAAAHEGRTGALPLVGRQLGIGDAGEVAHCHMQARGAGTGMPAPAEGAPARAGRAASRGGARSELDPKCAKDPVS